MKRYTNSHLYLLPFIGMAFTINSELTVISVRNSLGHAVEFYSKNLTVRTCSLAYPMF